MLGGRIDGQTPGPDGRRFCLAGPAEKMQTRGTDRVVIPMLPLMPMQNDDLPVGIDKIGRTQCTKIPGKVHENPEPVFNRGDSPRRQPQWLQTPPVTE